MRRLAMVAGLGLVFGWVAVPAWGHAGFESPKEVMADTDQTITQSVPEERGPDLHNAKVIVEVPAGFEVKGCHGEGWECSTAPAQRCHPGEVHGNWSAGTLPLRRPHPGGGW